MTADALWVVGDVQGYLDRLRTVLANAGLIDRTDQARWTGEQATLVIVGDLVDRGPDGIGVIDFLMRLQGDGSRIKVLLGNHDILLLAARKFHAFISDWKRNGGIDRDLSALTDTQAQWLTNLPPMWLFRGILMTHADALFYLDYGSTVDEVNASIRSVLHGDNVADWSHLLDVFTEHRAFLGPDGCSRLDLVLERYGARRLVHGHTPVPRVLGQPAETVTAPYIYCAGRCVNVDPGFYLGGPGFAYSADMHESSEHREGEGEVLKANAPGRDQIKVGMDVTSIDGQRIGKVKQVAENEFLVDRPLARDLWVPFASVLATEDYTGNFHGPVQPTEVVLEVSGAHIDRQGWRHA